jgi:hypothetical protein
MRTRFTFLTTVLVSASILFLLSFNPALRFYPQKAACTVLGHTWEHRHTEDWIWFYNFKGVSVEHPEGYQYRYIPNTILCRRCGTYLLDRTVVEDTVSPIDSKIRKSVPAGTPDSHEPFEISFGPPINRWPYKSGRLEGTGRDFYRSRQLRNEWTARRDRLEGPARGFHPNGKIQWEGVYKHGDPEGRFREYFNNGHLKNDFFYRNNQLEGEARQYYPSGALWRVRHYRAGVTDGAGVDYFEEGSLKREDFFQKGKLVRRVEHPLEPNP